MPAKQCSKCGATFACSSEAKGCWCESLKLNPQTLSELRQRYDDCLCENCLRACAEAQTDLKP